MKKVIIDGVEIHHSGKSAKGIIEFDYNEYAPDSEDLLRAVKKQLHSLYNFKAETVKVHKTECGCSDTFTAKLLYPTLKRVGLRKGDNSQ